ncbi:ankyrin repeat domain-containing protein [Ruegeria sp. 6PALISEP08]|uniref:ankyrin repeat domain-containing protein n=1 Tax=Ruegeria sp. 6PALISEP08 TaxID=1225660 RepID=UPI00067F5CCA|nr:ankyrin repeat domain-containing protein [Ruegeria sp. 6PALISEP08]
MTKSLDQRRRDAKALGKALTAGDKGALLRVHGIVPTPRNGVYNHADCLHVIARETGYASWPALKRAVEMHGMDRAQKQGRLRWALYNGSHETVVHLLADEPDLADGQVPLLVALYDVAAMRRILTHDADVATRDYPPRRPMCHLAFSKHIKAAPEKEAEMLAMAELLVAHGADVNDSFAFEPDTEHRLSALYGAIGHADNMPLAKWLLENGANPDDNESLYHSTELGHTEGLRLLLEHGAHSKGTNALPRAIDFNNAASVRLLLEHGADPNEGINPHPSGEPSLVIPALHQVARRLASGEIAQLLLDHGANPNTVSRGHSPYAFARIFGNQDVAAVLERAGASTQLSSTEEQLARAADGKPNPNDRIDMSTLSEEMKYLLCRLVWREGTLPHMQRLVVMGFDPNLPDEMGMTPLHLAAWEGVSDVMSYFLTQDPDLDHTNAYGGTLLSTIIHGSENCPQKKHRDHIGCARLALENGVALPRKASQFATVPEMSAFLADWAESHPEQIAEHGVV